MSWDLNLLTTRHCNYTDPSDLVVAFSRPSILWFADGHLPIIYSLYEWKIRMGQEGELLLVDVLDEYHPIQSRSYCQAIECPTWAHYNLTLKEQVICGYQKELRDTRAYIAALEDVFFTFFMKVARHRGIGSDNPPAIAQRLRDRGIIETKEDLSIVQKALENFRRRIR